MRMGTAAQFAMYIGGCWLIVLASFSFSSFLSYSFDLQRTGCAFLLAAAEDTSLPFDIMFSKSLVACLSLPLLLAPCELSVDALCRPPVLTPPWIDVVNADIVSLFVPDTPGLAVSADILGVDGSQTTWRLSPGQPSGTLSITDFPVGTHASCITCTN